MKVFIGSDHRGVEYKEKIKAIVAYLGHDVIDVGVNDAKESCDYPDIAKKVGENVVATKNARGILVCMSGIGQSIAANKIPGIYAALCYNDEAAALSRQHNNANVLVLSSKFVKPGQLKNLVTVWFASEFEGDRHERRFNKIKKLEKDACK